MWDVCVCVCGYTDREMTLNGIGAEFKAGRAYVYLDVVCIFLGRNPFNYSGPPICAFPPSFIFVDREGGVILLFQCLLPQSPVVICWLNNFGGYLVATLSSLSVQTFQSLIVIHKVIFFVLSLEMYTNLSAIVLSLEIPVLLKRS